MKLKEAQEKLFLEYASKHRFIKLIWKLVKNEKEPKQVPPIHHEEVIN